MIPALRDRSRGFCARAGAVGGVWLAKVLRGGYPSAMMLAELIPRSFFVGLEQNWALWAISLVGIVVLVFGADRAVTGAATFISAPCRCRSLRFVPLRPRAARPPTFPCGPTLWPNCESISWTASWRWKRSSSRMFLRSSSSTLTSRQPESRKLTHVAVSLTSTPCGIPSERTSRPPAFTPAPPWPPCAIPAST